ncbi:Excinuclease ABC [Caenispirillum salinarum AK4]|uniref:Excinuclease ABC n=1 Tax=Caenispirillum salinarum AK4 TaxID=1238182 RepID=K9H048_9PROT|nr:GIY-YIG nuclease family protein [Caenispirillum salinarum]EKV30419.1 Excinuclease ABC [Caenispirillum salinarum AK4]
MPSATYVYVLLEETPPGTRPRTYVGWTTDVDARLAAHNGGTGAKFTKGRRWRVVHVEEFQTRPQAMSREWHLKRDRAFRRKLAETATAS